jgi:hypothetical protein
MAITKDKGFIKKFGGGELWYQACGDDGTPTAANAWVTFGYIGESKLSDVTESEGVFDETGNQVTSLEANRVVKFSGLFMQTGKDHIDFLKETVRGKYFNIYHDGGIINGKQQEIVYGICTIKPMVEIATGTKRIPFEFTVLKNEAAIGAIVMTAITNHKLADPTIPLGEYYIVTET